MKRTIFEHTWRGSSQSFARTNSRINKSHDLNKPIRAKYTPPNHQLTNTYHHFWSGPCEVILLKAELFILFTVRSVFQMTSLKHTPREVLKSPNPTSSSKLVSCVSTFPFNPTCQICHGHGQVTRNHWNQMVISELLSEAKKIHAWMTIPQ